MQVVKGWCRWLSLACVLVLSLSSCGQDPTPWDRHMDKGEQYLKEKKYGPAETEFRTALLEAEKLEDSNSQIVQSLRALAILYDLQGEYEKAEPLLKRVIAIQEQEANSG